MVRLSRLTAILLQLQSKNAVTARDLANRFAVSQRTIYRDIKALELAGVPVLGEAGVGYSLMEGYKIPPVMFTEQEVNALITAQKLISRNTDRAFIRELDNAVTKIKAILRHQAKERSQFLEERVRILNNTTPVHFIQFLSETQTAITNFRLISICYHSLSGEVTNDRKVEPLALYITRGNWLLIAYCTLRQDLREFRLDRIKQLNTLDIHFRNREFSFEEYISDRS